MAEILEVDSVDQADELKSFDTWDSLTILSIIALCDETYGVQLTADDIEGSLTIGGLNDLLTVKHS